MANYTKGQWEQSGSIIWKGGEDGGVICQMAEYRPESGLVEFKPISLRHCSKDDIQMGNARLIAAAPDMYEALKNYRELLDTLLFQNPDDKILAARMYEVVKALNKVEGK